MAKKCKSCGADNRDEAKFCASCGAPIGAVKEKIKAVKKPLSPAAVRMRAIIAVVLVLIAVVFIVTASKLKEVRQSKTIDLVKGDFETEDTAVFSGITRGGFEHQGLKWQMAVNQIKGVYRYAADSKEPDFMFSMMVNQPDFLLKLPHANFMCLGIYDNKLYAVA